MFVSDAAIQKDGLWTMHGMKSGKSSRKDGEVILSSNQIFTALGELNPTKNGTLHPTIIVDLRIKPGIQLEITFELRFSMMERVSSPAERREVSAIQMRCIMNTQWV